METDFAILVALLPLIFRCVVICTLPKQEGVANDIGRLIFLPPATMLILLHNVYVSFIFPVSHIDVSYSPLRKLFHGLFSFAGTDTCSN